MKTASVFLDKGGVGKTTSTAHFGVALSEQDLDVLLIDLAGKQGDLAKHFGVWTKLPDADERWPNIATVLSDDWSMVKEKLPDAAEDMIVATDEGPDLIPAHVGLDQVDDDLASVPVPKRYQMLESFLDEDIEPLGYDIVLVDLPGLTNNVTLNGLWATERVIAPVELGEFERQQMEMLEEDIDDLSQNFEKDIEIAIIVPNRVDTRTNLSKELLDELDEKWNGLMAPDPVPKSQDIRNSQRRGETVFAQEEVSSTAERARESYRANSETLLRKL
ncbi:ParA family protein [Haloarcula argentinensis]|uniref:Chromosome partitioning protein ParA n=1 Tax=Haloarcula argentinensis TaxID=43776 RepID=A0A830FX93_HALAR|nr:ParA family protein [Haloarcula argentinensis]GGM52567.1 chromosome partitioning protein ParA [Haloarcula argentinensis]